MEAQARVISAMTRAIASAGVELTIEAVFRAHCDDVYRMVGRLLGPGASTADIEDLTQLVFIAVQRSLPNFRGESKLSTWIYGVATRVVMSQLRGWRRNRRLIGALEALPPDSYDDNPERSFAHREELIAVWRCLLKIKPKKRVVYVMHEIEGLSGPEIAEILSIPVATVWTRLHHARRELLSSLERARVREIKT